MKWVCLIAAGIWLFFGTVGLEVSDGLLMSGLYVVGFFILAELEDIKDKMS